MNPSLQPLVEYIESHRKHGTPEDQIWIQLLNAGWEYGHIQEAINAVDSSTAAAPIRVTAPATYPGSRSENHDDEQSVMRSNSSPGQQHPIEQNSNLPAYPEDTEPAAPQKYRLFRAIGDVGRAVMINWIAMIAGISIILVMFIVLLTASGLFAAASFSVTRGLSGISTTATLVAVVLWFVVGPIITAVVNALLMSIISLCVKDGIEGHSSSIKNTITSVFASMKRVVLASALVWIVIFGPLFIATGLLFLGLFSGLIRSGSGAGPNIAVLLITVIGCAGVMLWAFLAFFRYALAPHVALMEHGLPIRDTLGRSNHLLLGGGKWFLFKGFIFLFLILLVLAAFTGKSLESLENSSDVAVVTANVVLTFLIYGVLYALYRNRVAVKG